MFFNCKLVKNDVLLRAVAYKLPHFRELSLDVIVSNTHRASSRDNIISQTFESCRFPRAINSQQGKTIAVIKAERSPVYSYYLLTGRLLVYFSKLINLYLKLALLGSSHTHFFSNHVLVNLLVLSQTLFSQLGVFEELPEEAHKNAVPAALAEDTFE